MDDSFFTGLHGASFTCEILEEGDAFYKCQIVDDKDKDTFWVPPSQFRPIRDSKKQHEWPVGSRVEVGYRLGSPLEPLGWWPAVVCQQVGPRIVEIMWTGPYADGSRHRFHSHCLRDPFIASDNDEPGPPVGSKRARTPEK